MCSRSGYNYNFIVVVVDEGHREEERNFFLPELFGVTSFLAFFPIFLKTVFRGKSPKSLVRDYYDFYLYCDSLNVSQQIVQQINDFFPVISHEIT